MKKRLQTLVMLGFIAMLGINGCTKEQEAPVVEETPEIIVEEVEIPEEVVEEVEEEKIPLTIHVDTKSKRYYFENGEEANLYLQYCDVTVEGDAYENLKRNIENWSMERSEQLRSLYNSFGEVASSEEESEYFFGYSLYQTVSTARADGAVVSLLEDDYQYEGHAAHGSMYREGINFDSATGNRLTLADLFYDYAAFAGEAKERVVYELREKYGEELSEDYVTTVDNLWKDGAEPQWYLDASGIVIVLQEYSVGPYAMGMPEICLPYAEFAPYIKVEYLPQNTAGVASFQANQEIFLNLPGIEEEVSMMLVCEVQEDAVTNSLWLGQNELPMDDYLALGDAYLLKNGDDIYCMIEADMASDDYVTYIYRLTNGVIEKVEEIYGAIDAGNMNAHEVTMESWINILGTYGGAKNYHFDEEGNFVTEDTEYIFRRNDYALTTTVELPVSINDVESTLPAGSHIILNATDGETYVKFTIQETGEIGILKVVRDKDEYYKISIDGKDESECFEMLPYAG